MNTPATIALVGNPNVGKSVFFHRLTGNYAEVSNYPGTTVDVTSGYFDQFQIMDTPGVYDLSGHIDEEKITMDVVTRCDFMINLVDITTLSRDLFLTLSLAALGKPMVLIINMMDQGERLGLEPDFSVLRDTLHIPVYPVASTIDRGILQAKYGISHQRFQIPSSPAQGLDSVARRSAANKLANQVLHQPTCAPVHRGFDLDTWLFRPFFGLFLVGLLLCGFYVVMGQLVAHHLIGFTQGYIMKTLYTPAIHLALDSFLTCQALGGSDSFIHYLFLGEYGLLTMVPTYLLGLLLPMIFCFYLIFSALEDLGLLPRISVLTDRFLRHFGLNGKAIIPIGLGFGCVTMALISTRILESPRERTIASVLLSIAVPCSAQFVVLSSVMSSLHPHLLFFYFTVVSVVFALVGTTCHAFLPGKTTELFLVLPPLRLPSFSNILQKTARKTKQFLSDAGPLFLLGGLLFSMLGYCNGFPVLYRLLSPLTTTLLQLPEQAASLFLLSMMKRDLGAAQLYDMVSQGLFTPEQTVIVLLVITFFMPCFASLSILFKEQGFQVGLILWMLGLGLSVGIGTIAAAILLS